MKILHSLLLLLDSLRDAGRFIAALHIVVRIHHWHAMSSVFFCFCFINSSELDRPDTCYFNTSKYLLACGSIYSAGGALTCSRQDFCCTLVCININSSTCSLLINNIIFIPELIYCTSTLFCLLATAVFVQNFQCIIMSHESCPMSKVMNRKSRS